MQRGKIVEEVGIPSDEAGERGLKFLCVSYLHACIHMYVPVCMWRFAY